MTSLPTKFSQELSLFLYPLQNIFSRRVPIFDLPLQNFLQAITTFDVSFYIFFSLWLFLFLDLFSKFPFIINELDFSLKKKLITMVFMLTSQCSEWYS